MADASSADNARGATFHGQADEAGAELPLDRKTQRGEQSEEKFPLAESTPPSAGGDTPASAAADTAAREEEDIEEYMASLLERLRGKDPQPRPAVDRPAPKGEKTPAAPDRVEPVRKEIPAAPPTRRPAPAPERRSDLSNMRELANLNARSAIEDHAFRKLLRRTCGKFMVVAVAPVVSSLLGLCASSVTSAAFLGSLIVLIVGIYWTVQFFGLTQQLAGITHVTCGAATQEAQS